MTKAAETLGFVVGAGLVGVGLWMAWIPLGVIWAGLGVMILALWSAYNATADDSTDRRDSRP